MKKAYLIASLIIFLSLFPPTKVFAESNYVLPYPALMPGNKFYKLQEIKDSLLQFWYFGDFGQFTYNLKQSDKYLVEAKTLYEYKQYLLGSYSLQKSDLYFQRTPSYLKKAQKDGKNIVDYNQILKEASLKHIEVLEGLQSELPDNIIWKPEKATSVNLNLKKMLDESIKIRIHT